MQRPAWHVAGVSVKGSDHRLRGDDCQDRHCLQVTPGGALIAVASDGAGSARLGGEGASSVCGRVAGALNDALDPRPAASRAALLRCCRAVRDGIAAARAEAEGDLADYHATLVGAAMLPGVGGLFFHIGDGAALALAGDRWVMSPPRNGEYAHETYFFTQDDWRRQLRFKLIEPGFDTIFVMTDGVTDIGLKQSGRRIEPFMPFFEPIGRFLTANDRAAGEQALGATLDSDAVRARSNDDKTLVWAKAG